MIVIGTTREFERVRNLFVDTGSFVSQEDVDSKAKVVVLGRKVKDELFGDETPLGKVIMLSDARYRVVGVMMKKGTSLTPPEAGNRPGNRKANVFSLFIRST